MSEAVLVLNIIVVLVLNMMAVVLVELDGSVCTHIAYQLVFVWFDLQSLPFD